jgi:NarL family two-component system sensor histidine kinase LiaS
VYTLYPQAVTFLQPGREDLQGLQSWADDVYASGYASLLPQDMFDSAAAKIVPNQPMYVLSPDLKVLAQAPKGSNPLIGRKYAPPDFTGSEYTIENAQDGSTSIFMLYVKNPNGDLMVAVPVLSQETDEPKVLGVIVVTVEPPPPMLFSVWPLVLGAIVITGILLLFAVAPFGTLFGFIMSHGLTRRIKNLTAAADAWSEGNFQLVPVDRSKDEIGELARRMRNMAERVQFLLQSQQELAQMEERNRLARELHDTVKQQTFATLMQVRAARNLLENGDPDTAKQHLEEAEGLIKTPQQELGRVISELRPAALDGRGLGEALRVYLENWSNRTHIPSTFQTSNPRKLPLAFEQALYRVTQEALSNVARHSRASAVNLSLLYGNGQVSLRVADNGIGFDLSVMDRGGFGLQSMRDRLAVLGGNFEVRSSSEQGTTVTAVIPTD